jgi:signal transduction histidine kinase
MLLIIFGMLFHFTKVDIEKDAKALLHSITQDSLKASGTKKPENNGLHYFTVQINIWGEVSASGYTAFDLDDERFIQDLIIEVLNRLRDEGYVEKYDLQYYRIQTRDMIVISFVDQSGQQDALDSLLVTGAIIGGISLLVFFVISLFLAKWMVRPVDVAWNKQKQFLSDASHELKTPLTVIMANAELLQNADETERQRYSNNILTMSHRMRDLVEGMLNLSRVDNGQVKSTFAQMDLSRLVDDALLPFEPLFFEKGLTLQSNVEKGIIMNGSDRYLSQVVQILLDNAVKYSQPGIVELQLQRYGRGQAMLTVSNPGNPIDPDDRERIFDRFYRADEARTGSGSFGLGLAIAKSMVEEHGGRIWVESNETGNCFCIILPIH